MRIRTIKPAFWANEKMAVLPDFARLLAIGLLNYADDLGFFWANSLMIRGSLFPFEEDSSKIRKGLAQLESEGYVILGKTADGREVGKIVNFSKHQRVDKPQKSEIEPLAIFEERSKNGIVFIDDDSALYSKGKEGKGKEEGAPRDGLLIQVEEEPKRIPEIIPPALDTEPFKATWAVWKKARMRGRKPLTPWPEFFQEQLGWLEKYPAAEAIDIIKTSLRNGWVGLIAPDRPKPATSSYVSPEPSNFRA